MIGKILKPLLKNPLVRSLRSLWKKLTAGWKVLLEKPVPEEELINSREAASIPSFGFFFLLICATILATMGLVSNSTAVIIGAMIVAPLMNPILSMAFAIVIADWKLYKRSIVTVASGVICTILISFLIAKAVPVDVVGSEIVARTTPNLLDLVIAIAAGAAGAFSLTRQSIASSIAGVAIAVALVPPLCVTGIGLGIGAELEAQIGTAVVSNLQVSTGSFLLFIVNLAGITFTACLIFLSQSYGSLTKAFQTIFIWLLIIALLCGPLTGSMENFIVKNLIIEEIRQVRKENPEISSKTQVRNVTVKIEGKTAYISVLSSAPKNVNLDEYYEISKKRIFESLKEMGMKSVKLNLRVYPVEIKEYEEFIDDLN